MDSSMIDQSHGLKVASVGNSRCNRLPKSASIATPSFPSCSIGKAKGVDDAGSRTDVVAQLICHCDQRHLSACGIEVHECCVLYAVLRPGYLVRMIGVDGNRGVCHSSSCVLYGYDWRVVDDEAAPYHVEAPLKSGVGRAAGADEVGTEICSVVCRIERVLILPCLSFGAEGFGYPLRRALKDGFGGNVEGCLLDASGHARDGVCRGTIITCRVEAGSVVAGLCVSCVVK